MWHMTTGHRLFLSGALTFQHSALSSYALTCALPREARDLQSQDHGRAEDMMSQSSFLQHVVSYDISFSLYIYISLCVYIYIHIYVYMYMYLYL